ncbi:hypothetical protein THRCLA_00212, partial [Thraustotheca clavata]
NAGTIGTALYTVYLPQANKAYTFQAQVANAIGPNNRTMNFTFSTSAPTLPGPPRQVTSPAQTGGEITLSWRPPLNSGGLPITGYRVYYTTAIEQGLAYFSQTSSTNLSVSPLVQETLYIFAVVTVNTLGAVPLPGVGSIVSGGRGIATNATITQLDPSYTVEMKGILWQPAPVQNVLNTIQVTLMYSGSPIVNEIMVALGTASPTFNTTTTVATLPGPPPAPIRLNYSSGSVVKLQVLSPKDTGDWNFYHIRTDIVIVIGGEPVTSFRIFVNNTEVYNFAIVSTTYNSNQLQISQVLLIPGFTPSCLYYVAAVAVNIKSTCVALSLGVIGNSALLQSNSSSLPQPVISITSPETTGGGIRVQWDPPFDIGVGVNSPLYYALYRSSVNTPAWSLMTNSSAVSFWVLNLLPDTTYSFKVAVTSTVGTSGPGAIATFSTAGLSPPGPCDTPTFVRNTGGSITIAWTPPVDNGGRPITSYAIQVDGIDGTQVTTALNYTIIGLLAMTNYSINVAAINLMGTGSASPYATFATGLPSPAAAPSNMTVVGKSGGAVVLQFAPTLDTGGVAPGNIFYSIYANNVLVANISYTAYMAAIAVNSPSSTLAPALLRRLTTTSSSGAVVGNLNPSTTYTFQVQTYSVAGGASPNSVPQQGSTTPPTAPGAPTAPTLQSATGGTLEFVWGPAVDSGGSSITSYQLLLLNVDTLSTYTCQGLFYQCTISGLDGLSNYKATLQVSNSIGASPASNPTLASTLSTSSPSVPVQVAATAVLSDSFTLNWLPPVDNGGFTITNYLITLSVSGQQDVQSSVAINSATLTGLSPNTLYSITVQAVNLETTGLASDPITIQTMQFPNQPQPPQVQCVSSSYVQLTWNAQSNAQSYLITRNDGVTKTLQQTTWLDTTVAPSTQYSYDLQVVLSSGTTPPSFVSTATTLASASIYSECSSATSFPIVQDSYSNRLTKVWRLTAPTGAQQHILLNFTLFSLECDHDQLAIVEYDVLNQQSLLWRGGCDRQGGLLLLSSTANSALQLTLTSDESVTRSGFSFTTSIVNITLTSASPSISCPSVGSTVCSGNGICAGSSGVCSCSVGYTGSDCSQRVLCDPTVPASRCPTNMNLVGKVAVVDPLQGDDNQGTGQLMDYSATGTATKAVRTITGALRLFSNDAALKTILLYPGSYTSLLNCQVSLANSNVRIIGVFGYPSTEFDCPVGQWSFQSSVLTIEGVRFQSRGILETSTQLVMSQQTTLNLLASTLMGGLGTADAGGCLKLDHSALRLNGTILSGCKAQSGGAIYAVESTITMVNSNIRGNTATVDGGGIFMSGTCSLKGASSQISANTASGYGGGIATFGAASMQTILIQSNTAAFGGGISIYGSGLTTTSINVNTNTATTSGGGVYIHRSSTWTDISSLLTSNTAAMYGGALFTLANGDLYFVNTLALANSASMGGGGVALTQTSSNLQGLRIQSCSTSKIGGGLLAVGSNFQLKSVLLNSNTAQTNGGGIALQTSSCVVSNVTTTQNTAQGSGGGVALVDSQLSGSLSVMLDSALTSGGGVFLSGASTLTSASVTNCSAPVGGGIFSISTSMQTQSLQDITVTQCSATTQGGGVALTTVVVQLANVIIGSNQAPVGGGAYLSGSTIVNTAPAKPSALTMNVATQFGGGVATTGSSKVINLSITSNTATLQGGGMYLQGSTTLSSVEINQCSTSGSGGGIALTSATLLHNIVIIRNCAATATGGGIYMTNSNILPLTTSTLSMIVDHNSAVGEGGNCYVDGTSSMSLTSFTNGNAPFGGSLSAQNASGTITSCTFTSSTATSNGGGIRLIGGRWSVSDTILSGNTANQGGGLHLTDSYLTHSNLVISNNIALNSGGGVFLSGASSLVGVKISQITQNQINGAAGANIYCDSASIATISMLSVTKGIADIGGGLYIAPAANVIVDTCTFTQNTARTKGGAIYSDLSIAVRVSSCQVVQNTALEGAAVYHDGGSILYKPRSNLTIESSTILSNTGKTNGVIYCTYSALSMTSTTIAYNNITRGAGGGITAVFHSQLTIDGSNFGCNVASDGGAISVDQSSCLIRNSKLSGSGKGINGLSECTNIPTIHGGLISISSFSQLTIAMASSLLFGTATYGGAIHVSQSNISVVSSALLNHSASQFGGIIYASEATLEIVDADIGFSAAVYDGGAVYLTRNSFASITSSKIHDNVVTNDGAAFLVDIGQNKLHLTNTAIYGNIAQHYGGGISAGRDSENILTGSEVSNNSAVIGGGVYYTDTTLTVTNSKFIGNTALQGGGIAVDRSGVLAASSSNFTLNSASIEGGGVLLLLKASALITQGWFAQNTAGAGGGMATTTLASVVLMNNKFTQNTAQYEGGALLLTGASTTILSESEFVSNKATDGAAIAVLTTALVSMNNVTFTMNEASFRGGGLYFTNFATKSLTGLTVESNSAISGGGVFWIVGSTQYSCTDCVISGNTKYDVATDSTQFQFLWWPQNATSGVSLLQYPDIVSIDDLTDFTTLPASEVWPRIEVQDIYGQRSLTENNTKCSMLNAKSVTNPISFEPSNTVNAVSGVAWFENSFVVASARNSSYFLEAGCTLAGQTVQQTKQIDISVLPCLPGYSLAANSRCNRCSTKQYSLDGVNCYDCPAGAVCTQYVATIAAPKSFSFGVSFPRTQPDFMAFKSPSATQSSCNPYNWDSDDPCRELAEKAAGGTLEPYTTIDLNTVINDCMNHGNAAKMGKYWPIDRKFSCQTNMSLYPCDIPGACPQNIFINTVSDNKSAIPCSPGYENVLCSTCIPGYKRATNGSCERKIFILRKSLTFDVACAQVNAQYREGVTWKNFILPAVAILILLIIAIGLHIVLQDGTEVELLKKATADRKHQIYVEPKKVKSKLQLYIEGKIEAFKAKQAKAAEEKRKKDTTILFGIPPVNALTSVYLNPEKIKIVVGFLQIFGSFKKMYSTNWTNTVNNAMSASSTINLDLISLAGLDCIFQRTFYFDFVLQLGIVGFFMAALFSCYMRGIRTYEAKLSSIPRNCIRCGHPVRDKFSRQVYKDIGHYMGKNHIISPKAKQSLHRLKSIVKSAADTTATELRKLQREFGTSQVKTDVLPIFPSRHLEQPCPTDDVLSGALLDRTLRSNLRVWQARIKLRMNYNTYRAKCFYYLLWLLFTLYPMVSITILNIFNCQNIGGVNYLVEDRRLQCYTLEWSFYATLGFVGVGVWVVGVPMLFFLAVYRVRILNVAPRIHLLRLPRFRDLRAKWTSRMREYFAKERGIHVKTKEIQVVEDSYLQEYMCILNLTDPLNVVKVGFLYNGYLPQFWWFDVLDLMRKLALSSIGMFLSTDPVLASILNMSISILLMGGILYYRPYVVWSSNIVMAMTQFQLILTLWVGLVLVLVAETGQNLINQDLMINVMLSVNLVGVIFTGYIMFEEASKRSRQEVAIAEAERQAKITKAVKGLWRKAYNYAVYETQMNGTYRTRFSVPAIFEELRRHQLEVKAQADKDTVERVLKDKHNINMSDDALAMAAKLGLRCPSAKKSTYHDNAAELFSTVPNVPVIARRRLKPVRKRSNSTFMELMISKPTPQSTPLPPVVIAPPAVKQLGHVYPKNQVVPLPPYNQTPPCSHENPSRQRNLSTLIPRSLTPTSLYIEKCIEMNLVPEPIMKKAREKCIDGRLNLSIGDQLLSALSQSLAKIDTLTSINLKGNRLTDESMSTLLPALLESSVKELDLSWNGLALRGITHILPLITASHSPLVDLNLENNCLGDKPIVLLSTALTESRHLTRLNLSQCNIGHQGAIALGKALKYTLSLLELHVSWNKIRGVGAAQLALGLQECSSLKTFDVSWNSFASISSQEALVALCSAFQTNRTLTHLDLSHNRLCEKDCTLLSDGLANNTTLRGLHLSGNELHVDAYGFIIPDATQNDPAKAHIFTRIGSGTRVDKAMAWEKRSNCWICECWVETRITWKQLGRKPSEVLLRAEFDYWQPHHLFPCAHDPTLWEIYRMVPPGTSQFYIVVDDLSKTTEAHCTKAFEHRIWGGISNKPKDVMLPSMVNTITVDAKDSFVNTLANPRAITPTPGRVEDWFTKSVFVNYRQDTPVTLSEAFVGDWNISRMSKISKDASELEQIKAYLLTQFHILKEVFRHYAINGGTDPFTLGSNAFSDFLADCEIVDNNTCTRAEVEMCFIASSSSGPKAKWNTRRSLYRFQFIETIAFLSISKFVKSKRVTSTVEALKLMMNNHIIPKASYHDSQAYRMKPLYTPVIDLIFKDHLQLLKEVFSMFAGSIEKGDPRFKRLTFAEFMSMCEHSGLIDEGLATREVKLAIVRAKETEAFDPTGDGEEWSEEWKKVGFNEFIEACARIADAKDLTTFYNKVKTNGDTNDLFDILSSKPREWGAYGNLALKLPVVLKQICLPLSKARKMSIAPLMLKQIALVTAKTTNTAAI